MTDLTRDTEALKAFNANVVDEFRNNAGKVGGPFEQADILLLTTTGAKSGRPRMAPLVYLRVDGKMIIFGSFAGADKHPAWVHNLRASSHARVELGTDEFDVVARELPPPERDEIFAKVAERTAVFTDYQAKTTRVIPLFELQRL